MPESEKGLYIANAWKALVTETARKQLESDGWSVDGNWLNSKSIAPLHKVILAAPAYFDGAVMVFPKDYPKSRVFSYLIYPDEMVGWDYKSKTYKLEKQETFIPLLEQTSILSESKFTLDLVASVYGNVINPDQDITYLPVEFNQISKIKMETKQNVEKPVRVLWNHMWRSDKGFKEALLLIDQLSSNYPKAEFCVARDNLWGNNPDTKNLQINTAPILVKLRQKNNVFFRENFGFKRALEYWQFLTTFDVGFSVSYQEGFGLSMLEQSSAGIACVMPPRESYPEIHKGGLITENVGDGIAALIEDVKLREGISQSCQENARRFNAEEWAKIIITKIG
ncbi:MAG: hypothetical protein ABIJ85_00750 [bacterium]